MIPERAAVVVSIRPRASPVSGSSSDGPRQGGVPAGCESGNGKISLEKYFLKASSLPCIHEQLSALFFKKSRQTVPAYAPRLMPLSSLFWMPESADTSSYLPSHAVRFFLTEVC